MLDLLNSTKAVFTGSCSLSTWKCCPECTDIPTVMVFGLLQRAHETSELFKWKSSPMAPVEDMGGKKTLPPLTTERGGSPVLGEGAGKIKRCFDTRPIPVEVKKRVQRMEDRIMKEPVLAKVPDTTQMPFKS